jgi:hypothetical protein
MSQHDKIFRSTITLQTMVSNISYLYYVNTMYGWHFHPLSCLPTYTCGTCVNIFFSCKLLKNHNCILASRNVVKERIIRLKKRKLQIISLYIECTSMPDNQVSFFSWEAFSILEIFSKLAKIEFFSINRDHRLNVSIKKSINWTNKLSVMCKEHSMKENRLRGILSTFRTLNPCNCVLMYFVLRI